MINVVVQLSIEIVKLKRVAIVEGGYQIEQLHLSCLAYLSASVGSEYA